MKILKILLPMILLFSLLSLSAFAECETVGEKVYTKFSGADVTFSGTYSPLTNGSTEYNVTNIKFYYPDLDTQIDDINNTNSDLTADFSFETDTFTLESGENYLYLNATNVNSTDATDVEYECQKILVSIPSAPLIDLLPILITILVATILIASLVLFAFKRIKQLQTGDKAVGSMIGELLFFVIAAIIILSTAGVFLRSLFV